MGYVDHLIFPNNTYMEFGSRNTRLNKENYKSPVENKS